MFKGIFRNKLNVSYKQILPNRLFTSQPPSSKQSQHQTSQPFSKHNEGEEISEEEMKSFEKLQEIFIKTASSSKKDSPLSTPIVKEILGPKGLEPTRYGDWEKDGRTSDF